MTRKVLHGVAVSAGIAIGRAFFLNRGSRADFVDGFVPLYRMDAEIFRLDAAFAATHEEIENAQKRVAPDQKEQLGILAAHLMICKDPKFITAARANIREKNLPAEQAVTEASNEIAKLFDSLEDTYFRERVNDLKAIAAKIIRHLGGGGLTSLPDEPVILLAHDLTPADTLALPLDRVLAFATEEGGRTGHTGILARSLQLPAVVGISGMEEGIADGDTIILDALRGLVLIKPDQALTTRYQNIKTRYASFQKLIIDQAEIPAETLDGMHIAVRGNIEMPREAERVLKNGGEGVGLYRTEFGFITRTSIPSESELYAEYSELLTRMAPHKVTFRTLDVGADKMHWSQKNLQEANPALGLRAIRFCLRNQYVFRRQLRAILRASVHGNAALMFPLISGVRELRQAKAILNEVKQELDASNVPFDRDIPVGIMIELPSSIMIADALALEVDFFSIGTNDLIQYTLGIDRVNKHVAYLYQPLHPAIIRGIKLVADAAHQTGISISVCGEMASDPYCLAILLGMGINDFSMAPQAIPGIKHILRNIDMEECRGLLNQVIGAATVEGVNRIARQTLSQRFAEELPFFLSVLDTEE
ncbi:Phosphoenolpyruvate-protein phosphotransferase [uncultured delta proteobacterium]|uniref:Phosphoenolpyruvate-protein phosphotransferase n=1 Tax=uncultured delta proteobacterium TaxID=34034 RepID=A0A212J5M7_9DELT|nr:Phosphoenolpyruvate-protein phosphotransferase [uncultured delta proteobacterium]